MKSKVAVMPGVSDGGGAAAARNTEVRLRRSVRLGIWKSLLGRAALALLVYVILGSALLAAARRFFPNSGWPQSPVGVISVSAMILFPLIVLSARQVLALAVNLEMAHLEVLEVLSKTIAIRDNATEEHNLRVAIMAVHMASAVGLDQRLIPGLFIGALLHDAGKVGVGDSILRKPEKLSADERREMERHVLYGDEILPNSAWLGGAGRVVRFHHERFDGGGYPEGRKGDEIPLEARLFAIVDVFDALTSTRPYRQPMGMEEALITMEQERGTHFDPAYLDAFKTIAEALYTQVVRIPPEGLKELCLELIETYYAHEAPRRLPKR